MIFELIRNLILPAGGDVEALDGGVGGHERHEGAKNVRRGERDDGEDGEDVEAAEGRLRVRARYCELDGVDVPAESVEDAAEWGGLEEGHAAAHD